MEKNILVSIIVPVYNAKNYIDRCMDSLLKQSYENTEIILINDGSKDNSFDIIKDYEKQYKNVRVYTQKNQGPGIARNVGIMQAKGDYITFVDSDDFISLDYIQNFMDNVNDNEIVLCGYKLLNENLKVVGKKNTSDKKIDIFRFVATCCKLYKRSLLINNNILFPKGKIGEDILFSLTCYSFAKKIKSINYFGYNIVINKKSLTHSINENNRADLFDLVKKIDDEICLKKYDELYLYFYLKTIIMNLFMQPKTTELTKYYDIYIESFKWLEKKYQHENRKIKIKWYNGEEFKINICINLFLFCKKTHLIKIFLYLIKKSNIKL